MSVFPGLHALAAAAGSASEVDQGTGVLERRAATGKQLGGFGERLLIGVVDRCVGVSSNERGSRFECRLDRGKFKPCGSPRELKRLGKGKHRFVVRAVDRAGNVDPTPAKARWRIVG